MEQSNVVDLKKGENITITNRELNNHMLVPALAKLNQSPVGVKLAYQISYITKHIDRHIKQGREIFLKLSDKYAEKDEQGNLVPDTTPEGNPIRGTFKFKDDESKDAFKKEEKEFFEMSHDIPKKKININELEGHVTLSAQDISALSPLLCGFED